MHLDIYGNLHNSDDNPYGPGDNGYEHGNDLNGYEHGGNGYEDDNNGYYERDDNGYYERDDNGYERNDNGYERDDNGYERDDSGYDKGLFFFINTGLLHLTVKVPGSDGDPWAEVQSQLPERMWPLSKF